MTTVVLEIKCDICKKTGLLQSEKSFYIKKKALFNNKGFNFLCMNCEVDKGFLVEMSKGSKTYIPSLRPKI